MPVKIAFDLAFSSLCTFATFETLVIGDWLCLFGLASSLLREVIQLRSRFSDIRLQHVIHNGGLIFLTLGFLTRHGILPFDTAERLPDDDDDGLRFAPESGLLALGLGFSWFAMLGSLMQEFEGLATTLNICLAVLSGDFAHFLVVASMMMFSFSAAAAALYLQVDKETGDPTYKNSIIDFFFMQFVWPLVDITHFDLGYDSPHAGERNIGGSTLVLVFGLFIPLIGQNMLIAMLTTRYEEMKRDAELDFKVYRVDRVVNYVSTPRLADQICILEFAAVCFGLLLRHANVIDFEPDGGWQDRPAFPWEAADFRPSDQALERVQNAQRIVRAVLLGEKVESGVERSNDAVRRMLSNRPDRAAHPSGEAVWHIFKAEVHAEVYALDKKVHALDAKFDSLREDVDEKLSGLQHNLGAKLDAVMTALAATRCTHAHE